MPSFADVVHYADYLKFEPVRVNQDHCVAVRNRNSSCKKCVEACLANAISIKENELALDFSSCVNCGVCASVCPTFALSMQYPQEDELYTSALQASVDLPSMAVIACSRALALGSAEAAKVTEIPCLGHCSEKLLLQLVASGHDDIVLVDGDCATCKFGSTSFFTSLACNTAADMIEAVNAAALITRTSEFPEDVQRKERKKSRGAERRGIFSKTGSYAKRIAESAGQKAVLEKLGEGLEPRALKDRLGAGKSGRMPTFEPATNFSYLDSLEAISPDKSDLSTLQNICSSRRFGQVDIDYAECSGCGLCVLFCPTAALSYAEYDTPQDENSKYLEFSTCLCTQCMLCQDVCMRNCLQVRGQVTVQSLYDFEPELIEIPKPHDRVSIFDYKK